jgi:mannose-6-phosphate isomerase-like protein (cupin superfamily)
MNNKNVGLLEAIEQLKKKAGETFVLLMKHGTMSLEYFAPQKIDTQSTHQQDELYIIARGHGQLNRNGEIIECKAGDVLFVPAGMEHRFEKFSDDFASWVIFYGPNGGEKDEG